jgi:hypothetical protein
MNLPTGEIDLFFSVAPRALASLVSGREKNMSHTGHGDFLLSNQPALSGLRVLRGERLFDGVNGWNSTDQK